MKMQMQIGTNKFKSNELRGDDNTNSETETVRLLKEELKDIRKEMRWIGR